MNNTSYHTSRGEGVLSSIITVFVFLVILAVAIWGGLTAMRLLPSLSLFGGSDKTITVTAPTEAVQNAENFSLEWKYGNASGSGVFSFSYACVDGFHFEAPVAEGGVYGPITCNLPYGVPGDESGIRLVPKATAGETRVPVTIGYTNKDGEKLASTTAVIVVGSKSAKGATTTPAVPATKTAKPASIKTAAATAQGGAATYTAAPADLAVYFLGTENRSPGLTTVRFEVRNQGGKATGAWGFIAELPTYNGYHYASPTQASLNPGDGIVFSLDFDQSAGGVFSISVDPEDWVNESNEGNNFLAESIWGVGYVQNQYATAYYPSYYTPTYNQYQYYVEPTYYPYTYQDPYASYPYGYQDSYQWYPAY